MSVWDDFLREERLSRDVIAVRRIYVRIAGDLAAGVMLSQIIYWFLPDKNGNTKTSISFDGEDWIAKKLSDWDEECVLSPDQARRCLKLLTDRGLIVCVTRKFNGTPTTHIRVIKEAMMDAYREGGAPNGLGEKPKSKEGQNPSGDGEKPKSSNKEETTAKTTAESSPLDALAGDDVEPLDEPKAKPDPRWNPIREDLKHYWEFKNPKFPMPWAAKVDGKALKLFLTDNPDLTQEQWLICLRNRARSDVPHGDHVHRWIRQLLRFAEGPRDRFDKLITGNGGQKHDQQQQQNAKTRSVLSNFLNGGGQAAVSGELPLRGVPALESGS